MRYNKRFQVIVGNVGTVYNGNHRGQARQLFTEYARMSRDGYGKSGHETVIMLDSGDIVDEYEPSSSDYIL